jgi:enoyl-[acyl-carrier protein] reductase II
VTASHTNRICQLLNIEFPILEGGLAYVGNGALAAAISNGGGFGVVGSAGRSVDNFADEIRIASELTTKPFGVNLPLSEHRDSSEYIQVILDNRERIKAVSLSAGNPRPLIPVLKAAGFVVMVLTSTVMHSLKAEQAGADIVICEGFEAGGHNGPAELTLFSLIPQVSKAVKIPVAAAGGIADGRGIAAAIMLGADGVQLGTRFVATVECQAHNEYKKSLVEAVDDATVVIERSIGRVTRVLKGPFVDKILEVERTNPNTQLLLPYIRGNNNKIAAIDGLIVEGFLNCGQAVGLIQDVDSATNVVRRLAAETEEILRTSVMSWLRR